MKEEFIEELYTLLKNQRQKSEKLSYTARLIKNSNLLGKKIGEESTELIIDFIKKNKNGAIHESADLIYHLLVLWVSIGITPHDVWSELSKRKLKSGIEEKKNRRNINGL